MGFVRKAALALTGAVLAGGLVTATSGAASAAPAPKAGASAQTASAATCPAPGHRIKDSSSATVYLVGPGGRLYYFPDSSDYFGLYTSYSGITTVSSSALDTCYAQSQGIAYALVDARLDKVNGTPESTTTPIARSGGSPARASSTGTASPRPRSGGSTSWDR
jgi:hypothetical protein